MTLIYRNCFQNRTFILDLEFMIFRYFFKHYILYICIKISKQQFNFQKEVDLLDSVKHTQQNELNYIDQNIGVDTKMDAETYEYMLTIYSITLSVKFPCRMSLHADGKVLSMEVQAKNNVFLFNQDVKIKVKSNEQTEVSIFLSTGKSGHILAGVIPLTSSVLDVREGENLTVGLQKCLDATATCLLKVNHSWKTKEKAHLVPAKSSASLAGIMKKPLDNNDSPELKKFHKNPTYEIPETFSERHGHFVKSGGKRQLWSPYYNPQLQKIELEKYKVRQKINVPESSDDRDEEFNESKNLSHKKRKHKSTINETENNLRLDIQKQKTKAEQLEKTLNDKNKNIKQLKERVTQLQRKKFEKQYMEDQLNNKQNTIKILEDRLSAVTTENNMLRENLTEQQKVTTEIKSSKKFDILQIKEEFQKKQNSLKLQLSNISSKFNQIQLENTNKTTQLTKAKKYIQQLERISQDRIFTHEELIQDLKKEQQLALDQKNNKIVNLEEIIKNTEEKVSNSTKEINKLNEKIGKKEKQCNEFDKRIGELQNEISSLNLVKNQYQVLLKKYDNLEEVLRQKQKEYEKSIHHKTKEIQEIEEQNKNKTVVWEEKLSQAYEKNKDLKGKNSELQNDLFHSKNQQEKLKKQIQKLEKSISSLNIKNQNIQTIVEESNNKIQSLERELQEKINEFSHNQSLLKIEIEHKNQEANNLSHQIQSLESKHSKTCSAFDNLKTEKLRLENKLQLLEDNSQRTNQYLSQKKAQFEIKEQEFKEHIQKLGGKIDDLEYSQKQKQKQLNSWEIADLNNKNRIQNLQKSEKNLLAKLQGLQKVIVPKLQDEKKNLKSQLQEYKQLLKESEEENKQIINDRTKLESETNKNSKINNVLNEEKLQIINEMNKLKTSLSRSEKKEETLKAQMKALSDELKKSNLKVEMFQKQNSKSKQTLSETVSTVLNVINRGKRQLKNIQSKETIIYDLSKSRFLTQQFQLEGMDIRRMSEIIETSIKEQQNHIIALEDTNRQYKESKDQLINELNTLSELLKQNQEKSNESIEALTQQLEETQSALISTTEQYEDKLAKNQLENSRIQKDMKYEKQNSETLRLQLEALKKKLQVTLHNCEGTQSRLSDKVQELSAEIGFYQLNIKELQATKKVLDERVYQLDQQNRLIRMQVEKKDKQFKKMESGYLKVMKQCEQLNSLKKKLTQDLLSSKQEINNLKEELEKTKQMLKQEEYNRKKLQEFTNTLIKQKQVLVKGQLQASSKLYQLQSQLMEIKTNYSQAQQQISEKQQLLLLNKSQIKDITNQMKDMEMSLTTEKQKSTTLSLNIEGLEKKIVNADKQKIQLESKLQVLQSKMKKELLSTKQQLQDYIETTRTQVSEKDKKILDYEEAISDLEEQVKKKNSQISQFEQTIFFEKQKSALLDNTLYQIKKETSDQSLSIQKLEQENLQLVDQIGVKQEKLYEYSGHLYQMEQKLQKKEGETLLLLQKADSEWQNKHDEVCEQYEQKLEAFEKEKLYFKEKYEEIENQKSKLLQDFKIVQQQYIYKLESLQQQEKEHETEKIFKIGEKSKELQHAKQELTSLQSSMKSVRMDLKKKDHQILIKEQSIAKLEKKMEENEKITNQLQKSYETELTSYKNKELGFKSYKQQLRNCQWSIQRESKKITQAFIQKVVVSFPQAKEKLSEPLRQLQQSMSSVINFKI